MMCVQLSDFTMNCNTLKLMISYQLLTIKAKTVDTRSDLSYGSLSTKKSTSYNSLTNSEVH